jgi:HEPN domain-containing protein
MIEAKTKLVRSWLLKAKHDLASAKVLATSNPPLLDTALYHCQQAAEKALKGYLVFCDQEFERVHDLEILIHLSIPYQSKMNEWIDAGIQLTPYARIYRYPGYTIEPSKKEFDKAISVAEGLYDFILSLLPGEMRPE